MDKSQEPESKIDLIRSDHQQDMDAMSARMDTIDANMNDAFNRLTARLDRIDVDNQRERYQLNNEVEAMKANARARNCAPQDKPLYAKTL